MRTMKAHTRLDLNTSSLIWEYCAVRRRKRTDRKGGEKEMRRRWRNMFSDKQRRHRDAPQSHQTDALTVLQQALERDRSRGRGGGAG